MSETIDYLASLRRPRLLISAARFGLDGYRRDACLRRLLGMSTPLSPAAALEILCAQEAELEAQRSAGEAGYSVARHVEVMIAMMAESRLGRDARGTGGAPGETSARDGNVSNTGTVHTQYSGARGRLKCGANVAGG